MNGFFTTASLCHLPQSPQQVWRDGGVRTKLSLNPSLETEERVLTDNARQLIQKRLAEGGLPHLSVRCRVL